MGVCIQAKLKVVEEDEKEAVDRLKQRYKNEDASTISCKIDFLLWPFDSMFLTKIYCQGNKVVKLSSAQKLLH